MKKSLTKTGTHGSILITNQKNETRNTVLILLLMGLLSMAVRYLLSYVTVHMPTVYIDEGLYINIARGLFCSGQVLYRAQPVTYVYLLYPIVLMPLFLLPKAVSLYRAVQLYNAFLISTGAIPAYLLGKDMGLTRKNRFVLVALTLLVPEFGLSSFLTAESLYYPMMMWVFAIAARICVSQEKTERRILYAVLGVLTGLSYFAKPVCVIFGCCFALVDFIWKLQKDRKAAAWPLLSLVLTGAVVAMGYVAYNLLFGQATVLNLYEKQLTDTSLSSIPIMVQAVIYHILALVISFGGAFILMPLFYRKQYAEGQQEMLISTGIGIVACIIGIAIMVVPYNYTGEGFTSPVHLRYLMYFCPLILVFFLSESFSGRIEKPLAPIILIALVTAASIFPSAFRFFNYQAGCFDAPALNAFYERNPMWAGVLLVIVSVVLHGGIMLQLYKKKAAETYKKMGCIMMAVFFLVNGICAYTARRTDERRFEVEATEMAAYIADEENVLVVTTNSYADFRGYHLDSHLRKPLQTVVMNEILINAAENGGKYSSWTPFVQAPNAVNNPTIDADTLLFDLTTADYVEFTEHVKTTKIGEYVAARIEKDKPFLKTAIASMDGYKLPAGETAYLLVFDEDMLQAGKIKMTITMRSYSGNDCNVTISSAGSSNQVTVGRQSKTFEITMPISGTIAYDSIIVADGNIIISEYSTMIAE